MHVISRKALREFAEMHDDAETPLDDWYRTAKRSQWSSIVDVRKTYPHADAVGNFTVFNIGGNKYRLATHINYMSGRTYIRHDAPRVHQEGLEAMKNSALAVDPKRYGRLLARRLPAVIRTEKENERLIAELQELDEHYSELTPEEREYSELLTVLIEAFEDRNYDLSASTPDSRLRSLMEEHGLRQRDLLDIFGSRGVASEVVSGKRAISKAQAKKLAALFHVPADLFL